ncbi:MAG: hypothetical protein P4L64_07500 [Caulobacteraceae bacterium]|nr:hypothetical protein [Caulobacteraceae bacterium]
MLDAQQTAAPVAPVRDEVHVLLIAARSSRAALLAVEDALGASDAELCRLNLKPVGEIVEATVKLRGIDAGAADRLAARVGAQLGVCNARVEHLWGLK